MTDDSLAIGVGSSGDLGTGPSRSRSRGLSAAGLAGRVWRFALHEPLVHFCLLGGLIFTTDAILHPPSRDERVITVTRAMRQSFIDNFDEDKERTPSDAELKSMVDSWVASEILYREGKALGVDRGDDTIRDRIAFKLQLLIFDQIAVPEPSAAQLRSWFEANRGRFDVPERVSFYLSPAYTEAEAKENLAAMRAGQETSDLRSRTRVMIRRPVASLVPVFGEAFRDELLASPIEQWSVLHATEGWHVVRLDAHYDAEPARFEDVREKAAKLWHTEETRRQAWEAVNRLKASYTVRVEP